MTDRTKKKASTDPATHAKNVLERQRKLARRALLKRRRKKSGQ